MRYYINIVSSYKLILLFGVIFNSLLANSQVNSTNRYTQIDSLKNELKQLKSELLEIRNSDLIAKEDKANQTIEYANLVTQFTGIVVAVIPIVLALFFGLAAFLGFREFKKLKQLSNQATQSIIKFEKTFASKQNEQDSKFQKEIDFIKNKFEAEYKEIKNNIALEASKNIQLQAQSFFEASYYFTSGTTAYKKGDNASAIENFQKAVKILPNALSYCRIGRSYTNLDKFQEAISAFGNALLINPISSDALYGMATAYRYIDQNEAIKYALKSTESDIENFEAHNYLGLIYRDIEEYDKAIEFHHKALRIQTRAVTFFYLALLYAIKNDFVQSKNMMQNAISLLSDELIKNQIRPLWSLLIRLCNNILNEKEVENNEIISEMKNYLTSERAAKAALSHIKFLLYSLNKQDSFTKISKMLK